MPSAEVLLEHAEFLRRLARGILHDADAADDVAQDAMVAALDDRPKNLRAWLGKVARHLALSRRRAEARRDRREHEAARPEALPSAAEGVARLELQRRVVDAVLALDEPYRSVVVHRFFYDLGPVEIATRLQVPVETVRTRLRRALDRLRSRLDESHGRQVWSVALLAIAAPRKLPLGGILAMSAKTKLVAASVLVLACAGIGVSVISRRDSPAPRAPAREEARVEPEIAAPPPVVALPAPVDFATIDRDRDVHGVVVDAEGNPVAGADVRVVRYPAMGMAAMLAQAEAEEGPGTRTASDGSFALRVERGEEVDLRVKADGFVALQRRWCPAGGMVRVVMRKGVTVRVRAVGPDGMGLPGVHVGVFKGGPDPEMEAAGLYVFLEGTTDEQGTCVVQDLLPGHRKMVYGWHPDLHIPKPVPVQLPETGEVEAQLTAVRARDVAGRVTDAATMEPVTGAIVVPYPMPMPLLKGVTTSAAGTFRYPSWSSEGVGENLYVHAEGYATARETVGDRTQVDFALQRGSTVMGIVRDVRGNPVADAYVAAEGRGPENRPESFAYARSDARGLFELRSLRSDLSQTLIVMKPGFARFATGLHEVQLVSSVDHMPVLEVVLPDARRLEGRVLGPDGEPFEGAEVELNTTPRTMHKYERHTDDLGRFRFADLPSGAMGSS
jgi:RNA polymerase sigma-70 factor (ECF subfamily)